MLQDDLGFRLIRCRRISRRPNVTAHRLYEQAKFHKISSRWDIRSNGQIMDSLTIKSIARSKPTVQIAHTREFLLTIGPITHKKRSQQSSPLVELSTLRTKWTTNYGRQDGGQSNRLKSLRKTIFGI